MKHFKRLFSYLVALTMVLSLAAFAGVNVHAEETTYKLTLDGTSEGHTYDVYKVFNGTLSINTDKKKVLSDIKWANGVLEKKNVENSEKTIYAALAEKNNAFSGVATAKDVAEKLSGKGKDDALVKDFAQVVGQFLGTNFKSVSATATSTEITGLTAGYYFVKDQDGSQNGKSDAYTRFIVQVVGDETATIKSGVPTVVKKVKDTNDSEGTTSEWQDSADYDIGDDVPYQITGTMPDNIADYTTYDYTFTDTMSKGLTYTKGNAKIKINDTDVTSSFTENVTTNTDGSTTVTWACDNLKNIKGVTLDKNTKVVVTYSCKLNENAVIGSKGNPNEVYLTYSNNPNNGGEGETGKTPKDKNIVFTYEVVVNKVDQDQKSLAGAAFKLEKKNSDGKYTLVKEFTAGTETKFEFERLDDGDYKLTETTTPSGYNTIAPIEFTISAEHETTSDDPKLTSLSGNVTKGEATFEVKKDAGSLTTNVENKKGSILPSTGGMGTTLLYVAGGILVACAAAYVIINRKKSAKK